MQITNEIINKPKIISFKENKIKLFCTGLKKIW